MSELVHFQPADFSQGVFFGDSACNERFEDGPGFWFLCCAPKEHHGGHYRLTEMSEL